MSDIGVIANQYQQLVDTSHKINNSVIAYKKNRLLKKPEIREKYPKLKVTEEEMEQSKTMLLSFLENVQQITKLDSWESEFIPLLIFNDYKVRLDKSGIVPAKLEKLIKDIKDGNEIVEDDLLFLDSIISILDTERNTLFRKLRKARG